MTEPPQSPGPRTEQTPQEKKANELESMLRWAGMSDNEIDQLRGTEDRLGPGWQRLAKAVVKNEYPGMSAKGKKGRAIAEAARPAMIAGLDFTREGKYSLQERAYRYEYFKALYDEEKRDVLDSTDSRSKVDRCKDISNRMLPSNKDVESILKSDIEIIQEERKNKKVDIDLDGNKEEIMTSVRQQADEIGMGTVFRPHTMPANTSSTFHLTSARATRSGLISEAWQRPSEKVRSAVLNGLTGARQRT